MQRKIKQRTWLVYLVIASISFNGILLALLAYLVCETHWKMPGLSYRALRMSPPPISIEAYEEILLLPYEEVCHALIHPHSLPGGYSSAEVALGVLHSQYGIDVERALGRPIVAQTLPGGRTIFSGLSRNEWKQIHQLATNRRLPLTIKGLFDRLPATAELFCASEPFVQIATLICRAFAESFPCATILQLCQEAGWPLVEMTWKGCQIEGDYSVDRLHRFLCDALDRGSRQAAYFLVLKSPAHHLEEYTDAQVLQILTRCDVKTAELKEACQFIASSNRSRSLRELASQKLR